MKITPFTPFAVKLLLLCLAAALPRAALASPLATASSYGGVYTNWPQSWIPLSGLNDPDDALTNERLDFVGDANNPGAYIAGNSDYLFFRVRVDAGSASEFSDTVMILIDQGKNGSLDYALMWDSQSADQTAHGLELGIPRDFGATWITTRMQDVDGLSAQKTAPPDFGLASGDGYIRLLTNQPTTSFGSTTLIDFAISWDYLIEATTLDKGQDWNIQLGSINQANDHNWIDYDVAGGYAPGSSVSFPGSASFSPTPVELVNFEVRSIPPQFPLTTMVILMAVLFTLVFIKRKQIAGQRL